LVMILKIEFPARLTQDKAKTLSGVSQVPGLGQVQVEKTGSTPTAIQHLKQCHHQTLLIAIVIGELGIWQNPIPTSSLLQGTSS
jgi:hypothetical protein